MRFFTSPFATSMLEAGEAAQKNSKAAGHFAR
jgi:hypothetical protein